MSNNNETAVAEDEEVELAEVAPVRNEATGIITVTCGANVSTFGNISGRSIGALRQDLGDVLGIQPGAKAIASGEEVNDDYITVDGDRIEFIKESGTKG
ncbi:MAG: hypothetical protein Q7K65_04695 [Candidatus Buchananbacteria bacterium]|nr:hypothetical protein [Candidatus Buchananbacteria bacterium]